MTTTTVSIGSNQSIDTETPAGSSGSGPSYVVTFGTTPSGIAVGDIGFMDTEAAGGGDESDYTFLVTAISGANITLKYLTDDAEQGDHSPLGLYTGGGSSGSPTQAPMVFKRAFSTITLFEAQVEEELPEVAYWGSSDDVVGECHADSTFTDSRVYFDNKQSLASVKLTVYEADRHEGTAGSGVIIKPTAGSGHNNGIIDIDIDNFTIEWIEIDFSSLDAQNTNKAIVLRGTNDDTIIRNNLIHDKYGNPGGTGPFMIHSLAAGGSTDIISILNNIVYNIVETSGDSANAININVWQGTVNIYNNTVYNVDSDGAKPATAYKYNGHSNQQANVKNNIASKLTANTASNQRAFWDTGTGTASEDYNLSDDTVTTAAYKATGSNSLVDKTLAEISFVSTTGGSEDLHLDIDSACREVGVDLGTTNEVNIDIDGIDRDATGVVWDMGADQTANDSTGNPAFMMFLD